MDDFLSFLFFFFFFLVFRANVAWRNFGLMLSEKWGKKKKNEKKQKNKQLKDCSLLLFLMALKLLPLSGLFQKTTNWQYFSVFFPRKQDLTFPVNCVHERYFAWNVKSCFLGKTKKNISVCILKISVCILLNKLQVNLCPSVYLLWEYIRYLR